MAQLADRVRQVERLKAEKARISKLCKNKIAYVEIDNIWNSSNSKYDYVEENEVNVVKLKFEPPYTCKLLKPSNGKNLVEPKNDKFVARTYTFDVTKCDEIFEMLVLMDKLLFQKGLKSLR